MFAEDNEKLQALPVYLLLNAVSACVPAQSTIERGNCSLPSPSPSHTTSKLRHGAPAGEREVHLPVLYMRI